MLMTTIILIAALVILLCVTSAKLSNKVNIPYLILFMLVGVLFGSSGLFKIEFNDYKLTENICSIALVFIMFMGGFNTDFAAAKKYVPKALVLSTIGVVSTAFITTGLCMLVLKMKFEDAFLIGSVISSTDAASVFNVLRKNNITLKMGTGPILEVESGSNDPAAYLLTLIAVGIKNGTGTGNIPLMVFLQVAVGCAVGFGLSWLTLFLLKKTHLILESQDPMYFTAMVIACYGISGLLSGNAYLSVYIMGIVLGNAHFNNYTSLSHYFEGINSLCEILIFFLIGLLSTPSEIVSILPQALMIAVFITFVSRPVSVFGLMSVFPGRNLRQMTLVSWAGLRGASSCVFAIMAVSMCTEATSDLFHIVFIVSLLSVSIQGALLPPISKALKMNEKPTEEQ